MNSLSQYDWKKVRIVDPEGKVYKGLASYTYPDENDEGIESLTLEVSKNRMVEFFPEDIVKIEIV